MPSARDVMGNCYFQHCGQAAVREHAVHKVPLCDRCHELVERFGHPRTLGDLSNLVALAILKFGPSKVRAALNRLENLG